MNNHEILKECAVIDYFCQEMYKSNTTAISNGNNFNVTTSSRGQDGLTPYIGENGNWWIGTTDTGVIAAGQDGENGITPHIDATTGNWFIGDVDTGIRATGTDGVDGIDGTTPNITANAVSVPSTSSANVVQSGTAENPIFTFEIPRGADGTNGENGVDGTNGIDGITPTIGTNGNWFIGTEDTGLPSRGEQGEQGVQGIQGEQGIQGSQGIQGVQGENGVDGASLQVLGSYDSYNDFIIDHPTGNAGDAWFVDGSLYVWNENSSQWDNVGYLRGPQGVQGEQGIQGIQGEQGIQGVQGQQGEQGEDGIDGRNAYEIAVDEGFVGTIEEWLASLQGTNGETPYVGTNGNWFIGEIDTGVLARGYVTPRVHHCNLSAVNSQYQAGFAPLSGVNRLIFRLQRTNTTTITAALYAARGDTITFDLKRATQYDATWVEGYSVDGGTVTNSWLNIDTQIYANSNEFQKIYMRVRDPIDTTLWSLYEISVFCSANGARTDIWFLPIYEVEQITVW